MQVDNLSWFPGHMTKPRRMITAEIKNMDAVCEILDARIPLSSRNPDVDELTAGKPRLVVLNRVDQAFFLRLLEAGKDWFYWDYDVFYTRRPSEANPPYKHEAGEFILRNLNLFPNQLPDSWLNVMSRPKQIRFLSAPTENAQARFLPQWM